MVTWSLSRSQSPADLHSVTIAMRSLDVEARSEACPQRRQNNLNQRPRLLTGNLAHLTCLLLEQGELFDGPLEVVLAGVSSQNIRPSLNMSVFFGYLSEQFCLGDLLVDLLGEVLVGLERGARHLGRLMMMGNDGYGMDERMWR